MCQLYIQFFICRLPIGGGADFLQGAGHLPPPPLMPALRCVRSGTIILNPGFRRLYAIVEVDLSVLSQCSH